MTGGESRVTAYKIESKMFQGFRELSKYRELLVMLTWKEIRIKYKQSIMGFLWAIFMPLIIVSAGILVKYAFSVLSESPFTFKQVATVSVKSIPWAFFVSSLRFATNSLIGNANLVTKIYFPKEIFPFSAVLSQLPDFLVASSLLTVVLGIAGIGSSIYLFWLPLFILMLVFLVIAMGTFLSAAALFFRDVKYLVEVILTFAIFFTPVFYEANMFEKYQSLLLINPVAPILEGINDVAVLHQAPDLLWILYSGVISLVMFVLAYIFFKKAEPAFAESI